MKGGRKLAVVFLLLLAFFPQQSATQISTEPDYVINTKPRHQETQTVNRAAAPPHGVVGWWPGEGNAQDVIGENDGEILYDTSFAPGIVGQAFSFDGEEDEITIPTEGIGYLERLTIEAWVFHNTLPDRIERYVTIDQVEAVLRHNGRGTLHFHMRFIGGLGFQHIYADSTLEVGVFHHVAATYDGIFMRLYCDGREVGHLHVGETPISDGDFGAFSSVDEALDGLLDEVSIYNRALNGREIRAIYNAGSNGKSKPPDISERDRNIVATVGTPIVAYVNNDITIDATVINEGAIFAANVTLQLWINNSLVTSQLYRYLHIDRAATLSYQWTPTQVGVHNITAYAIPFDNEVYVSNNVATDLLPTTDGNYLVETDPVLIQGNEGFVSQGWPGDGTSENPFIISGLSIASSQCIVILDTVVHFTIKNCYLSASSDIAVWILGVWNAVIENNTVEGGSLWFEGFYQSVVANNQNTESGWMGIMVSYSRNCLVANNQVESAAEAGIQVEESRNNVYTGNWITGCRDGYYIVGGDSSNFTFNYVRDNWNVGINIDRGSDNMYFGNLLDNNHNAWDNGMNNHWDDGSNIGNYWGDVSFNDSVSVEVSANSTDDFPLLIDDSELSLPVIGRTSNTNGQSITEETTMTWIIWSKPGTYMLYLDSEEIESGLWSGSGPVRIQVENVAPGVHSYELIIDQFDGGVESDFVAVLVPGIEVFLPHITVIASTSIVVIALLLELGKKFRTPTVKTSVTKVKHLLHR